MSQNVSFKRALTEFSFVIVDLYTSDLLIFEIHTCEIYPYLNM